MQALRISWRRCLPNALDGFAIGLTDYLHMLAFPMLNTDWLNIPYGGSRRRYAATCSTIRRCGRDNNEGGKGREDTLPSECQHHSWNPIECYATLLQTSTQFLGRTGLNLQTIVCCTTALLFPKPAYRMKQQRKPHHLKPPHQTFFFSPPCWEKVLQAFIWTAYRLRERGSRRRIGIANLFLAAFPFRVCKGRLIKPG
ncbi:hypothetical protein QR685DRAFT_572030 [Neurospora intermedia]|uniref:Uncharacterized protein n=1 Tax=Neurospora intermedia TaxID=5142 RepID=A0ABR3DE94_NEUIN